MILRLRKFLIRKLAGKMQVAINLKVIGEAELCGPHLIENCEWDNWQKQLFGIE